MPQQHDLGFQPYPSPKRRYQDVLIPVQAAHQNGMMPPAVTE
jgi:hypothetical protein